MLATFSIGTLTLGLAVFFIFRRTRHKSLLPLPPGPRKLPIIGNMLDWPSGSPWLTFSQWHNEFGTLSLPP